jgi:hypothetical protein
MWGEIDADDHYDDPANGDLGLQEAGPGQLVAL